MRIGETVEWSRGRIELRGVIVAAIERHGRVTVLRVRLDGSGRVVTVDPAKVEAL